MIKAGGTAFVVIQKRWQAEFMIKEFPRWNQAVKDSLKSAKEAEVKYQNLKKVNTEFMLAFQDMVKVVNGED